LNKSDSLLLIQGPSTAMYMIVTYLSQLMGDLSIRNYPLTS
jgi:hypothetical protein